VDCVCHSIVEKRYIQIIDNNEWSNSAVVAGFVGMHKHVGRGVREFCRYIQIIDNNEWSNSAVVAGFVGMHKHVGRGVREFCRYTSIPSFLLIGMNSGL